MLAADLVDKVVLKNRLGMGDGGNLLTVFSLGAMNARKRFDAFGATPQIRETFERMAWSELQRGISLCESPIERTFLAALITADYMWFPCVFPRIHDHKTEDFCDYELLIVPQFAFIKYRADFALVAQHGDRRLFCVVECDGADFHGVDRQVADRARDGYFESWGFKVFRFTGSEIYQDPHRCAGKVAEAVSDWRGGLK